MQWTNVSDHGRLIDLDGLDPYAAWLIDEDSGRFAFPPNVIVQDRVYPLMIELRGISIADFAHGESMFDSEEDRREWRDNIVLPPILTNPPANLAALVAALEMTTAVAKHHFFDILRTNASVRRAIRSLTISRPLDRLPSFDEKVRQQPLDFDVEIVRDRQPSHDVVVGIIDDGIAFAHERFRDGPTSTRIASIWLQSQQCRENPPPLFARGREITKDQIDSWLASREIEGAVDEDSIYREAGVLDFVSPERKSLARRAAHGTHVLDRAAGSKPGTRPQWPIVCVQLPSEVTADTSGARLTQWALEGVWYILLQSLVIASTRGVAPMPVVINLSYGFTAGPHDGGHPLERALLTTVDAWERVIGAPVRIVLPAGNNLQSRLHARISFEAAHVVDVPWRIHPDDRTPSHVEIWLPRRPSGASCPVRVSVRPPGPIDQWSPIIGEQDATMSELKAGNDVLCQISYSHSGGPDGRGVIRISVAPTFELDGPQDHTRQAQGDRPSARPPTGIWTIRVENKEMAEGEEVHAWVQRDDSAFGYPRYGRQSFFDDPEYPRFDDRGDEGLVDNSTSLVRRAGTLNAIATGHDRRIMVAGGYTHWPRRATRYSSRGPTLGDRRGPDVLAVSDRTRVLSGMLGAGTRSGSRVAMNGTSVSAPGVTRMLAGELAAGGAGDVAWLTSMAGALRGRTPRSAGAGTVPVLDDDTLRDPNLLRDEDEEFEGQERPTPMS